MLACRRTRAESLTELPKVCQPRKAEETDYVCSRVTHLRQAPRLHVCAPGPSRREQRSANTLAPEVHAIRNVSEMLQSLRLLLRSQMFISDAGVLRPRRSATETDQGSLRPKANQSLGGQEGTRLRRTFGKGKPQLLDRKLRLEVQPTHFCRLLQVPYCAQNGTTYEPGQLCWQRKGSI